MHVPQTSQLPQQDVGTSHLAIHHKILQKGNSMFGTAGAGFQSGELMMGTIKIVNPVSSLSLSCRHHSGSVQRVFFMEIVMNF